MRVDACVCALYRNLRWKCNAETRHNNMPSTWEGARGSVFDCLGRTAFVSEVTQGDSECCLSAWLTGLS